MISSRRNAAVWMMVTVLATSAALAWNDDQLVPASRAEALVDDDVMFEIIGQVKNSASPGAGLPATSVQYGYLPYISQLTTDETFVPGGAQNETTARFTFYNDSITLRVTPHGNWTIITREGTMTVYYHLAPAGDLTTPDPDSFRSGTPIQTSTWRHQVIFEPGTGHFFVTFVNTITSSSPLNIGRRSIRLGKPGNRFRISLVGGPDPAGKVNGKFAGNALAMNTSD